jgi:hypothetical protein
MYECAYLSQLVTRSLVLYVCFVDRCLSFCNFSFGRCVVCSSMIYGFWLPLWYLRTLHSITIIMNPSLIFKYWSIVWCLTPHLNNVRMCIPIPTEIYEWVWTDVLYLRNAIIFPILLGGGIYIDTWKHFLE